jgi:nucleoid-associated protein YgaU
MLALLAAMAGCASGPSAPDPAPAAVPPSPAAVQAASEARSATVVARPAAPELSPAQAKAQAQRLALEAVDQLQNGNEPAAQASLERALEFDAGNDLARRLMDQVKADAEKELGTISFRYSVQRDDSLSKLAQQFLGDRLRFYILAKYNGIANPSRLAVGQVLRIPGKAPVAETEVRSTPEPAASPRDASGLIARGRELQRAGDFEGAYAALSEAVRREPGNRDAMLQRNSARQALIGAYEREAAQAFQRQNLELAIAKWDRVVDLDPANRKAKLERERALDLQKKMNEKFGAK